jgi:hypothetical protein
MPVDRDFEIAMRDGVRVKVERARSHKMQQTHDTDLYPAAHRDLMRSLLVRNWCGNYGQSIAESARRRSAADAPCQSLRARQFTNS